MAFRSFRCLDIKKRRPISPAGDMNVAHAPIFDFLVHIMLVRRSKTLIFLYFQKLRYLTSAFIDPALQENPKLRDCRSDIYSIGAIWYWLLCGRAPHGSDMRSYLSNAAPNLSDRQIGIVMKCLAGNLDDRYRNCGELLEIIG